jgi:hypothetical protein
MTVLVPTWVFVPYFLDLMSAGISVFILWYVVAGQRWLEARYRKKIGMPLKAGYGFEITHHSFGIKDGSLPIDISGLFNFGSDMIEGFAKVDKLEKHIKELEDRLNDKKRP